MDYVKPVDFKQLKAFFLALQQGYFKPDSKQASATVLVDGVRTPVDKGYCLKLLRSFPDLQGDQFNDDASIIKYLQDPNNRKRLLGHLTQEQQIEITKLLAERPTATGAVGEQPGGGETSAEQGVPAQTPVDTTAGAGGMPGFPSGPSISSARQRIFRIPHAPEPSKIAAANKSEKVVGEHAIPSSASQRFNFPSFKSSFSSIFGKMQNFTSRAGVFFQRNAGKFFTVGRIGTAVSAGIGAVAGAGFGPIGALAGAGAGGLGSLWIRSGDGARFLGRMGNGAINAGVRFSNQVAGGGTRLSVSPGSKKLAWALLGAFFFLVLGVGLIGGLSGTTPPGQAAPLPGFIPTQAPPPSQDYQKLHDDIKNKFYIDFDMQKPFDITYLQFAWEKLWNISNANFLKLVKASDKNIIRINQNTTAINEQYSCSSIGIRGISSKNNKPYPKDLFNYVFLHELSHIIDSCNSQSFNKNQLQQIKGQEGYLTNFSQHADTCPGSVGDININEDFADTLAYFLSPEIPEQSLGIGADCEPTPPAKPPYERNKPLHQQFAVALLGTTVPLSTLPQISCPVVGGGVNILPSYQASPEFGHCGEKYADKIGACTDGVNSRRAKSIDIESCLTPRPACTIDTCKPLTAAELAIYNCGQSGKNVELPSMSDQPNLKWERLDNIPLSQGDCFDYEIVDPNGLGGGCGIGYVFRADLGGGKNWVLHLLHMGSINSDIQIGGSYSPGTVIGKAQAVHIHISIGKDIQNPLSQNEAGWMAADTNLKLCQ